MSFDLQLLLLVAGFVIPTGFVAFWAGVGATERRFRAREQELLDSLDFACALISAEPETPVLRLVK